jgi:hypothetical protein
MLARWSRELLTASAHFVAIKRRLSPAVPLGVRPAYTAISGTVLARRISADLRLRDPRRVVQIQVPDGMTVIADGRLQRGGTYDDEGAVAALLRYRTHDIHDLRSHVTTIGSADRDVDIRLAAAHVSARHCRIEWRARRALLVDDGSKNGTYHDRKTTFGLGLEPSFENTPVGARGVVLTPGATFMVGDRDHRFVAIDHAMRYEHPLLTDILGTEDEVRD